MSPDVNKDIAFFAANCARESYRCGDALVRRVGDAGQETDFAKWRYQNATWHDLQALFLTYSIRLYRFLKKLDSLDDSRNDGLNLREWIEYLSPLNDVRAMTDHLDDYISGKGRKQCEFVKTQSYGEWTADGSSLTVDEGRVILGQHFNVNESLPNFIQINNSIAIAFGLEWMRFNGWRRKV